MRIFLSGNEDVCRWHLPVAQAKAMSFVERCEKACLSQNTFHFRFEETGATMQAQYSFGQLSLQMHAPSFEYEEEVSKEDEVEFEPKTFFINTTQGYFWVEVRYDEDGAPIVILTPFTAKKTAESGMGEEFIYPGMGMQSFGMLAGCIDDSPAQRYVITQAGGALIGEGEEKGTIKMPGTGSGNARITVSQNNGSSGLFCVIENEGGKVAQVKVISVANVSGEMVVEMQHNVIDMLVEAEGGNITSESFPQIPTYIHRKCTGSYFSPNKTIGYHVDAGSDDAYHGNTFAIPPGAQDKLDNGMDGESYFNHAKDLYGIASLFAAPIAFDETTVSLVMVSPTLVWEADRRGLCWGGYGETQTNAGCIDLQKDFQNNIISPRQCTVLLSLSSKIITVANLVYREVDIDSWCGKFGATAVAKNEFECGPEYFYEDAEEKDIEESCSWTEEKTGVCDSLTGVSYTIEYPREQLYLQHWVKNFKENITVKRKSEFRFGKRSLISSIEHRHTNPYFLFDGLWHLDFGVMYLSSPSRVESCGLCAWPPYGQNPGELVYFHFGGTDNVDWILNNGHEYVNNLEVVEPLGMRMLGSASGVSESLGFIARVPESFEAPHEPEILTGGVSYPSEDIEGEIVKCEYSLMSAPCECDTDQMILGQYSSLVLNGLTSVYVEGGCPPFRWMVSSGTLFEDPDGEISRGSYFLTKDRSMYVLSGSCSETVTINDACSRQVSITANITSPVMNGPDVLYPGTTGAYSLDIGTDEISYSGTLEFVNQDGMYFTLRMPADACGDEYVVTLSGCGVSTTMNVRPTLGTWRLIFNGHYGDDGWMDFPPISGNNQWITQPYSGAQIRSTAYHGKYYVSDVAGTYGVTSGIFTAEECEEKFAIYGATTQATLWPTTNVADYINTLFDNDTTVAFAKVPGFPFVRAAQSWTGRYGYYLFNNNWQRNIYEWVCS